MSFKVGDRVRAVWSELIYPRHVGKYGTVHHVGSPYGTDRYRVYVTFDDGCRDYGVAGDFALVSEAEVSAEGLLEFLKGVARSAETSANPDDPRVALADEILREFFNVSTSYRNTCVVEFSQRERQ